MKPLNLITLLSLSILGAAAHAGALDRDTWLTCVARSQQSSMSMIGREPVRGVYVGPDGGCGLVGVVYLQRKTRGGEHIDNFRVCEGQVTEIRDVSPAMPDEMVFRDVVKASLVNAALIGVGQNEWNGYVVRSVRQSPMDSKGCARIETTVSSLSLLVSNSSGFFCP